MYVLYVCMYVCMYVSITIKITLLRFPVWKITLAVKEMYVRLQRLPILRCRAGDVPTLRVILQPRLSFSASWRG